MAGKNVKQNPPVRKGGRGAAKKAPAARGPKTPAALAKVAGAGLGTRIEAEIRRGRRDVDRLLATTKRGFEAIIDRLVALPRPEKRPKRRR